MNNLNKQVLIKLATLRLAINHVLRQRLVKQAKGALPTNELTPEELAAITEFMDAADTGKEPNDPWMNFTDKKRSKYLNSGIQGLKDLYDRYGYDYSVDLGLDYASDWDRVEAAQKVLENLYKRRFGKLPKGRGPWD